MIAEAGRQFGSVQNSLKDVGRVQFRYAGRRHDSELQGLPPGKQQLPALGAVRGIAQEVQSEEGMIVDDSVGCAQHADLPSPFGFQARPTRGCILLVSV